ncbi:hypothetical protein M426DRAFT_261530 [Hypoxylon sp. CI-4A]|nr:hypothetical protein M426DRAFT_261530 [Hypoxylon sp. CI-4A]
MKYTTATLSLISATLSLAAPTITTNNLAAREDQAFLGFALPSIIKNHNIATNLNAEDDKTSTIRSGAFETSTLYQIPIPPVAAGKTCALKIRAGHLGTGDSVQGEKAMDIFRSSFTDLATLDMGNLRDVQLARVRFNAATDEYDFDRVGFANPAVESFPCPAGQTLHWESVAVGDFDVNVVEQATFVIEGSDVPFGLSVGWW